MIDEIDPRLEAFIDEHGRDPYSDQELDNFIRSLRRKPKAAAEPKVVAPPPAIDEDMFIATGASAWRKPKSN